MQVGQQEQVEVNIKVKNKSKKLKANEYCNNKMCKTMTYGHGYEFLWLMAP